MELPIIFGAFILAIASILLVKRKGAIEFVSVAAPVIALVLSVIIAFNVASFGEYNPSTFFSVGPFGALMMLVIGIVGCATALYSVFYLREEMARGIIGCRAVAHPTIPITNIIKAPKG